MICHTNKDDIIFDAEDFDKVKEYKWFINPKRYANACIKKNGKTSYICFSRVVMGEPEGMVVDHINKDTLDNRKCNLRVITITENNRWKNMARNNTHGVIGVYMDKQTGCWYSSICVDLKSIYLGYYKTKEEAIIARLLGEKKYFGEFAPQQSLFDEYKINEKYFDGIEIGTDAKRKRHKWTEEETSRLKELYESGTSIKEISEILGLPASRVEGRIQSKHFHRKNGGVNH